MDTEFVIFETPGHTLDHIAYYSKDINSLFCGDTLFSGGCGRLFEGTPLQMFNSLNKIKSLPEIEKKKIRVGGMVKKGSIVADKTTTNFIITDFKNEIFVSFNGLVPNLFAEEKGVVAEGYLKDRNFFIAKKILAKHDENYMPPEVKEALKND